MTLDDLPLRPQTRRWAIATVRELLPLVPRRRPAGGRRMLAIFVDGLGARILARAARDGSMPFLSALRDGRCTVASQTFSGMPSTTTAFQAGLFYGLPHPDIPAFNWFDRKSGRMLEMNKPADALRVEARVEAEAGPGLMEGGTSYLSILRGGACDRFNTSGVAEILENRRPPAPNPAQLRAMAAIHAQTALAMAVRLAAETGGFLWEMARFVKWSGASRHEANFLLNHLLVGTLVKEVAQGQAILDLVAGVPRVFLNLHDFDEVSHRRGPEAAEEILLRIDRSIEALYAIAAAVPDPPDVWVFSDHGQIAAVPFEKRYGWKLAEWLRGAGDGAGAPPKLGARVASTLGVSAGDEPGPLPTVVDAGNYAHVYFDGKEPWTGEEIARRRGTVLARLLSCPGVGMVAMRTRDGAVVFAGDRRVDPKDPATVPPAVSPRAVEAILEEMVSSPSAGDLVAWGQWFEGGCVAFSWEWSSHGGPSKEETETFVVHPRDVPIDPGHVAHGADLHAIFRTLYGGSREDER